MRVLDFAAYQMSGTAESMDCIIFSPWFIKSPLRASPVVFFRVVQFTS